MCDKSAYREAGYTPRKSDGLLDASPMNPDKPKKKRKEMEFIEETMR